MNNEDYYTPELTEEQIKRSDELRALMFIDLGTKKEEEPSEGPAEAKEKEHPFEVPASFLSKLPAGTKPCRVWNIPSGLSEEARKGFMLAVAHAAYHRNKEATNYRRAGARGGKEKSAAKSSCWEKLAEYSEHFNRPTDRNAIRRVMRSIARKEPGAEFQDDCFNVDSDSLAVSTCWNRLKKEPGKLVFKDD